MTGVLVGITLPFKNMAEMPSASRTGDLRTTTIGINATMDRTGNLIIKGWPATTGMEFVFRAVERRIAFTANIGTGFKMICVLASERPFTVPLTFSSRADQTVTLTPLICSMFLSLKLNRRPLKRVELPKLIPKWREGIFNPWAKEQTERKISKRKRGAMRLIEQ